MVEEKKAFETRSRRKFIKNAGIVMGGAAIGTGISYSSLSAKEQKKDCSEKPWLPDKWDKEADVVVVGSGTDSEATWLTGVGVP